MDPLIDTLEPTSKMFQLGDGTSYWSMHPKDYVVQSVKMVQGWCVEDKRPWKKKRKNAMQHNYLPELDTSRELGDDLRTRYQQMIGILRWAVELGQIDIITDVSVLYHSLNTLVHYE